MAKLLFYTEDRPIREVTDMRFCLMGDSITKGTGCPAGEKCWAEQLADRFPDWEFINLAIAGQTSEQALDLIEKMRGLKPDIVSFQFGMNDHYPVGPLDMNVAPGRFRENILRLTGSVDDARVLLITNHPILEGDAGHYYFSWHPAERYRKSPNDIIEIYNDILRGIAELKGYTLVDMRREAEKYPAEELLISRRNTPLPDGDDGAHLHTKGNRLYADCIEKALREMQMKGQI